MLCEASEFERDLRTILLPGLLEYQQAIQEDMIDKWKLILRDAIDCCNRCSSSFQVGMVKICENVAGISVIGQFHVFFSEIDFKRSKQGGDFLKFCDLLKMSHL